ncbi:MAG: hypothetical protein V1904_14025 [Bacteroidota bacterium]
MKLTVIAGYGSEVKEISQYATVREITDTMNSINWKDFHQVVLTKDKNNWIEVGGNITDDGLSVVYAEDKTQYIIVDPPTTVEQMTAILLSYHAGDGRFKTENKFERE